MRIMCALFWFKTFEKQAKAEMIRWNWRGFRVRHAETSRLAFCTRQRTTVDKIGCNDSKCCIKWFVANLRRANRTETNRINYIRHWLPFEIALFAICSMQSHSTARNYIHCVVGAVCVSFFVDSFSFFVTYCSACCALIDKMHNGFWFWCCFCV